MTARVAGRYLLARFPPGRLGVAVLATYVCIHLLYSQALRRLPLNAAAVAGAATFVLLFVLMRMADDLDDLDDDAAGRGTAGATRRGLVLGVAAACLAMALLNLVRPGALAALAAAVALVLGVPFVVKRRTRSVPVLAACYEAQPAAVMVYGYWAWRGASGQGGRAALVVAVSALFWSAYEFWKISRMPDERGHYAYGLDRRSQAVVLVVLAAVAAAAELVICLAGRLPPFLPVYGGALIAVFAAWIRRCYPRELGFGLIGLGFVGAAVVGVFAQSVLFWRM